MDIELPSERDCAVGRVLAWEREAGFSGQEKTFWRGSVILKEKETLSLHN